MQRLNLKLALFLARRKPWPFSPKMKSSQKEAFSERNRGRIALGASLLTGLFFIIELFTLTDYGINWDTINHLTRGQAYLHFFLTGKKDYSDLPQWQNYYQNPHSLGIDADKPKDQVQKRSLYEGPSYEWFVTHETGGHPVVSDILSSGFNQLFFKKLGWVNDIDSYRLYGILLAASLVGLIFWWVSKLYGIFPGLVSALTLMSYPLFFAEAHFNNEKDIPETVYWSFLLFCIWKAVIGNSWRWGLLSGLILGLAIGTKFNIIFIPVVIVPWLLIFIKQQKKFNLLKYKKLILSFLAMPIIGFIIFFGSWPYLWSNPIKNIGSVIKYYKNIGVTSNVNPNFVGPLGINTYPIKWIIFTTPIPVLILAAVGIIFAIFSLRKSRSKLELLFLLWLLVPIGRVTLPGATIYGGIRQIMEYVPGLAIFSGIGAFFLLQNCRLLFQLLIGLSIIVLFIFQAFQLAAIHPGENVYFNELTGGLSGAKNKSLPAWGNSFGGPYRIGVEWIDDHALPGSKVALARELMPNIPSIWFRSDLAVSNSNRSGYLKKGEYVIGLVYEGTKDYSYFDSYLENFLIPAYEFKVDGVSILNVWQNDTSHSKPGWIEALDSKVKVTTLDSGLRFDLGRVQKLSRLEIAYSQNDCDVLESGFTRLSLDGDNWQVQTGVFPKYWRIPYLGSQPANGYFIEPFVGQPERYIDLNLSPDNTCLKKVTSFKVYTFK